MKVKVGLLLLIGSIMVSCGPKFSKGGQEYVVGEPGQKVYTPDNQNAFHTGPSYFEENFPYQTKTTHGDALMMHSYGRQQVYEENYYDRYNEYTAEDNDPQEGSPIAEGFVSEEDSLTFYVHYPERGERYIQPQYEYLENAQAHPDMIKTFHENDVLAKGTCCPQNCPARRPGTAEGEDEDIVVGDPDSEARQNE